MPGLSDSFWGRPTEPASGRPSCSCGGAFGPIVVLPATDDRGRIAERQCTACGHVVHVPVPHAHQPREVETC